MRIVVVVSGWAQTCCGEPFAVGQEASWTLIALDPASTPVGEPARYLDEQHGEEDGVPINEVTGTIVPITGVQYATRQVPGMPLRFTTDLARPEYETVQSVGAGEPEGSLSEYWLSVEIPEDTDLPNYVLTPSQAEWNSTQNEQRARLREMMLDATGVALECLADEAQQRYTAEAEISRDLDMSAITLSPRRSTAATIAWLRQADGNICATVGHGVWTLPDSPSSAEVLRELLEAAVAGRVSEIVRTWPASPNLFTQVRGRDGSRS